MHKAVIYTDGGASPNPGPASIGAVIKDENGVVGGLISKPIGRATNNEAEYRAVIAALEMASNLGAKQVELRSDSELLVRQINGQYKVKAAGIRPLYVSVKQLQEKFDKCVFKHIPRELNEAHELADCRDH
jgi:ribonuclease HI